MLMFFVFRRSVNRVILPGLSIKDLKPLSKLLMPQDLLVPIFFCSNLAQLMDVRFAFDYNMVLLMKFNTSWGFIFLLKCSL